MEIKITNQDTSRAKGSFQGTFDVKIKMRDHTEEAQIEDVYVFEIKRCTYFDSGQKRWVIWPSRKKQTPEGKWETDYFHFYPIYGKDKIEAAVLEELKKLA